MSDKISGSSSKNIGFESILNKLDSLVEKLENSDTKLESSLKAFEEGIKLTRNAQSALSRAEQKVHMLMEENGVPVYQDSIE